MQSTLMLYNKLITSMIKGYGCKMEETLILLMRILEKGFFLISLLLKKDDQDSPLPFKSSFLVKEW